MSELKKSTATIDKYHFDLDLGSFGSLFLLVAQKKRPAPYLGRRPLQHTAAEFKLALFDNSVSSFLK